MAGRPHKKPNKRRMARFDLKAILDHYPIMICDAKRLACVNESTWRRWMAGTHNPPPATVELIRLYAMGKILPDSMGECYFQGDALIDDHGTRHTLGDLRLHKLYRQHSGEYIALLRNFNLVPKPTPEQVEKGEQVPPFKIHAVA